MLVVGIELEVRAHGVAQPVLIGPRGQNYGAGYLFLSESKLWGRLPVTGSNTVCSPVSRQNYGAGYLFLSLESFASWRLERSGREILN